MGWALQESPVATASVAVKDRGMFGTGLLRGIYKMSELAVVLGKVQGGNAFVYS